MRFRTIIIALMLAGMLTNLPATPVITVHNDSYDVFLRGNGDIAGELNRRSPISENGVTYHAHTFWKITWNYKWQHSNGGCSVTQVNTAVEIKYLLPQARSLPARRSLRKKYKAYYAALKEHEQGHGKIGIHAANEIESRLLEMQAAGKCEAFSRTVDRKAQAILARYQRLNKDYDAKTQHGRTQGAYISQ